MSAVERVCELCGGLIPVWKAKNVKVCSAKCKFELKASKRLTKRNTGSLLHACLSTVCDPAKPHCDCKMRITDAQAQQMLAKGEAVNFDNRNSEYVQGAPLLVAGIALRPPRSETIERPHIERLTEHHKEHDDSSLDDLRKAIEEDQALRGEEEIVRLQIYGELTAALRRRWIVEVPADEYDRAEREAHGRCLFWFSDERTPGGIGRDVDPQTLAPLKPIEADGYEDETEAVESAVAVTNENEPEIRSESPENVEADKGEIVEISLDAEIEKEFENEEIEVEEAA
jgi:hypothetical protein